MGISYRPIPVPDEDEFQKWRASQQPAPPKKTGMIPVPDESEFDSWQAQQPAQRPTMAADATSRRRPGSGTSGDFGAATSNLGEQAGFVGRGVAANVLNAAQGIPGMEALEAGAGAFGSKFTDKPMNYGESLATLRGETEALPDYIKHGERFMGGGALAKALPLGPAKTVWQSLKQGAKVGGAIGGADAALSAEPIDLTDPSAIRERLKRGVVGAGIGAGIGAGVGGIAKGISKGREIKDTFGRVREAPTLGKEAVARDEAIEDATRWNYGAAELEGELNGGTSPAIQKALDHPRLKPFVDLVRNGEEGAALSDADVSREAYKLASKHRRGLKTFMERNGYDAARDLEAQRLGSALKKLKDASGAWSQKAPITMDIAGENTVVEPKITPGREAASGPVTGLNLRETTTAPSDPTLRQALRDFPESALPPRMQGPGGPAFQMRGQPDKVRPGVEVNTPAMRIQTAPAEDVPPVMPSFAPAVETKASSEQGRQTFKEGADNARRLMSGKPTPTKRLETQTPEAIAKWAGELAPQNAEDALTGVLGAGKEGLSLPTWTPGQTGWGTLTGLGQPASRLSRLRPLIDALDQAAGRMPRRPANIDQLIRLLSLSNVPLANRQ